MITARDLAAGAIAAAVALASVHLATAARAEGTLSKSAVFPWESVPATPTKIGAVRRFFQTPTLTLAELESHVTTLNPGQSPHAPHTHVNEELIILREGVVDAYVNGEWVPVTTGSIIFFASNVPHTVRNTGTQPATYYVVNWRPEGLEAGAAR